MSKIKYKIPNEIGELIYNGHIWELKYESECDSYYDEEFTLGETHQAIEELEFILAKIRGHK